MVDRPTLFQPIQLGALPLRSRLVLAPMTRNRAGRELAPGTMNAEYYAQRASAGLIITEGVQVSPPARWQTPRSRHILRRR